MPTSEVHTPLTGARPPTGNPGSATELVHPSFINGDCFFGRKVSFTSYFDILSPIQCAGVASPEFANAPVSSSHGFGTAESIAKLYGILTAGEFT